MKSILYYLTRMCVLLLALAIVLSVAMIGYSANVQEAYHLNSGYMLAADTGTSLDLAPVWQTLTDLVNFALLAIASVIAMWVRKWFNISNDSAMNQALHAALQRGVSLATEQVNKQLNKIPDIEVHNDIARIAARYAIDNRQAAVDYFGLDEAKLTELAKAYLPTPK